MPHAEGPERAFVGATKKTYPTKKHGCASYSRFMWAAEARYIQDNKEGKIPLFLKEAGFAVQELSPRYKGVQFLLATKNGDV